MIEICTYFENTIFRLLEEKKKESERKVQILNKEIENLRVEAKKPANYDMIIKYVKLKQCRFTTFSRLLSKIITIYFSELAAKEEKLRLMETEQVYSSRIHDQESTKREKLIKKINYQLNKATSLKKEAFTRVDELHDQVYIIN